MRVRVLWTAAVTAAVIQVLVAVGANAQSSVYRVEVVGNHPPETRELVLEHGEKQHRTLGADYHGQSADRTLQFTIRHQIVVNAFCPLTEEQGEPVLVYHDGVAGDIYASLWADDPLVLVCPE